ncbi:MAG: efflux RND transporter permease subunit [Candidatus Omnitrophica bacterium]|nr:efflux RND transporter permease subunit [Candidatus Omnitrophota bacterium]
MSLASASVRRPVTTCMVYLGIFLLGSIALSRLPQELYPPVNFPQLTVVTRYKDAAPEEIEILVTKPIEEVAGTVAGVKRVTSVSREEVSMVLVEFNWGKNMDLAALGVREKIDLIKEALPRGAEDPVVIKYNPFDPPIMVLNLSGDWEPHELLEFARKQVKNELEKVDGVAAVTIAGGQEREILVEVDHGRLQASGLPISDVVDSLSRANINYPAGSIKEAFYEYLIRTMGEFQLVREIPRLVVGLDEAKDPEEEERNQTDRPEPLKRLKGVPPEQRVIFLQEIAQVKDTFKEKESISRLNGRENLSLSIQKQAGGNTVQIVKRLREAMDKLRKTFPAGIEISVASDQSIAIVDAISDVRDAAIQGGGLAFIVLFLFLGSFWTSLNVTLAIPVAILATFTFMYFGGMTINTLSLGGLAFGVGMLVDAGIVVLENITIHRDEKKKSAKDAAIDGTQEVGGAIFGSVLTTVVVFFPLIFVVGLVGQFMKDFALTVTSSLLISWGVSLTLTPLLASRVRSIEGKALLQRPMTILCDIDRRVVRWTLRHKAITLLSVFLLFFVSLGIFKTLDMELMPKVDQDQLSLRVDLPPGTRLEATDDVVRRVERVLQAMPEVADVTVMIGSSKERKGGDDLLETLGSHQARILISLKPKWEGWGAVPSADRFRSRSSAEILKELKETLDRESLEGAQIDYLLDSSLFKTALTQAPIVVEVKGLELPLIEKLADQVRDKLKEIDGLYGVKTSLVPPSPETRVNVMKDRASAYHLSVSDIALTAQTAIKGFVATTFKEGGKEVDIRVRLRKEDREDLSKLRQLTVHSPLEIMVPLSEVAYFAIGKGPTEIQHFDQQRTIVVSAQLLGRSLNSAVEEVTRRLKEIRVPAAYSVAITGENEQMQESFRSLAFALVLSVMLVYMVMASEFESLWQPFLIMGTIPLSIIGVIFGLFLTGIPVSVMVGMGILILGGIVVDNGIVLIDCANRFRDEGMVLEEAVVEASATRMRPIFMTAGTTVLGLLPLAIGVGGGVELQKPMAVTVMWGLSIATFLTLIFLPTVYYMGERFFSRFHSRIPVPALEPTPALAGAAGAQSWAGGPERKIKPAQTTATELTLPPAAAAPPIPKKEEPREAPAPLPQEKPGSPQEAPPESKKSPDEEEPPAAAASPTGPDLTPRPPADFGIGEFSGGRPSPAVPEEREESNSEEIPSLEPPEPESSTEDKPPAPGGKQEPPPEVPEIPESYGSDEAVSEKPVFEWSFSKSFLERFADAVEEEEQKEEKETPSAEQSRSQEKVADVPEKEAEEPVPLPPSLAELLNRIAKANTGAKPDELEQESGPETAAGGMEGVEEKSPEALEEEAYEVPQQEEQPPSEIEPAEPPLEISPMSAEEARKTQEAGEPAQETFVRPSEPPPYEIKPPEPRGEIPAKELNPRQIQLLEHLKTHGRITRKEYVQLASVSVPTAARDLADLVERGLIEGIGPLAKGRYYILAAKP